MGRIRFLTALACSATLVAGCSRAPTDGNAVQATTAQDEPAIAKGRAAIQKAWADMMAIPGFDLTFATEQLTFASGGDMALDRGTYRFAGTPNGAPYEEVGKAVVVWRKVGGEWKVAADIFNSDRPATGS